MPPKGSPVLHAEALSPACPPQFPLTAPAPTLRTAARQIPSNFQLHLGRSGHPLPESADPAQASQQHHDPHLFSCYPVNPQAAFYPRPWHRRLPASGTLFPFLSPGSQLRNLSPESSVSADVFEGCRSLFHILFASLFSTSNQQQKATLSLPQNCELSAGRCFRFNVSLPEFLWKLNPHWSLSISRGPL